MRSQRLFLSVGVGIGSVLCCTVGSLPPSPDFFSSLDFVSPFIFAVAPAKVASKDLDSLKVRTAMLEIAVVSYAYRGEMKVAIDSNRNAVR